MTRNDILIDRLYKAVQRYVDHNGGQVVVVGGIQLIQYSTDRPMNFTIGIRCTGKMPVFKAEAKGAKR